MNQYEQAGDAILLVHGLGTPVAFEGVAAGRLGAAGAAQARAGVLEGAAYAQKTFSQSFSKGGKFAGQTVDGVASALNSGALSAAEVSIQYIVRNGNKLILNTRSAQALERAGIPRSQWNPVNMTGNAAAEKRLTDQLRRNGLDSSGIQRPIQK
jgi:filamentous hemagglutinin